MSSYRKTHFYKIRQAFYIHHLQKDKLYNNRKSKFKYFFFGFLNYFLIFLVSEFLLTFKEVFLGTGLKKVSFVTNKITKYELLKYAFHDN